MRKNWSVRIVLAAVMLIASHQAFGQPAPTTRRTDPAAALMTAARTTWPALQALEAADTEARIAEIAFANHASMVASQVASLVQ